MEIELLLNNICEWNDDNTRVIMQSLTNFENNYFQKTRKCYPCGKDGSQLIKDHDHFTGNE